MNLPFHHRGVIKSIHIAAKVDMMENQSMIDQLTVYRCWLKASYFKDTGNMRAEQCLLYHLF